MVKCYYCSAVRFWFDQTEWLIFIKSNADPYIYIYRVAATVSSDPNYFVFIDFSLSFLQYNLISLFSHFWNAFNFYKECVSLFPFPHFYDFNLTYSNCFPINGGSKIYFYGFSPNCPQPQFILLFLLLSLHGFHYKWCFRQIISSASYDCSLE